MKHAAFSFRDDAQVPDFDDSVPLAVMDGECAVCSWGARMINRLDRSQTVKICMIQSPRGAALLRHYGLQPDRPESWLFIDKGIAHQDFDAVIYAGRLFGGWGRLCRVFSIIPKPARDWLYFVLARNRYRIFGRGDICAIPDPAFQKRILT